jgi:hypothetical protein
MKRKRHDETDKKLMASIDREMNLPRLTESVREAKEEAAPQAKKRP